MANPTRVRIVVCIALAISGIRILVLSPPVAKAAEFCALRLMVTDAKGRLVGAVPVELIDAEGHVESKGATRDGVLEICDFDFGMHSVRVGSAGCFPTTVSNISLDPGVPLHLTVLLNSCGGSHYVRTYCQAYFRVLSADGRALGEVDVRPSGGGLSRKTDKYGRVVFPMSPESRVLFTFSAAGYQKQETEVACRVVEAIERKVFMPLIPRN